MTAFLERLLGLTFLDPAFLALGLLLPLSLLSRRRSRAPLGLAPAPLLGLGRLPGAAESRAPLPGSWRTALLPLPGALTLLGLLGLIVALARPAHSEPLPERHEGLDLVLCLDVSSSMTADDLDRGRTRLEVARESALGFVRARVHDRLGLVAFARYPDLVCPLTTDHEALASLLAGVTTVAGDGPEDATGIGAAVVRAAQLLADGPPRSRVVVLLTDGEENVAVSGAPGEIAPEHAAQACQRLGVRVYVIAAGTGRPDASGAWRRPDTRAVERLAQGTGGAFLEARDAHALVEVYARIDALERSPAEEPRTVVRDRFLPFLLLGLALIVLGRLLSQSAFEVLS